MLNMLVQMTNDDKIQQCQIHKLAEAEDIILLQLCCMLLEKFSDESTNCGQWPSQNIW